MMSFEFEYPLSAEEKALLRALTCSDLEHTTKFTFTTKDGKDFEFEKSRPHGKWSYHDNWIDLDVGTANFPYFECSECHRKYVEKYNYCPNCGAEMDEET